MDQTLLHVYCVLPRAPLDAFASRYLTDICDKNIWRPVMRCTCASLNLLILRSARRNCFSSRVACLGRWFLEHYTTISGQEDVVPTEMLLLATKKNCKEWCQTPR
eukprot:2350549-Amphidinium_carterae.1